MGNAYTKHARNSSVIKSNPVMRTVAVKQEALRLPTEIWVVILTMVVDSDCLSYEYCTSLDFPRLHSEWDMLQQSKPVTINDFIPQLRLVCRLWSNLIAPTWRPYVSARDTQSISSYSDIRSLYVHYGEGWRYKRDIISVFGPSPVEVTRNIRTLILYWPTPAFSEFFLSHPEYFPNVRSFSYISYDDFPQNFWTRLEQAFPRLRTLTIQSNKDSEGSITLPDLEILDISLSTANPQNWKFPSLKHLASVSVPYPASVEYILDTHGEILESLLFRSVDPEYFGFFGGDFWTRFPKLKLLGAWTSALEKLPLPAAEHPFHHICLYAYRLEDVKILLDCLPRLRHLSILSQWPNQTEINQVVLIDSFLTDRGAKQVEVRLNREFFHPELDQLRKHGSWRKSTGQLPDIPGPLFCLWELQ